MTKYHVTPKGKIALCTATKRACTYNPTQHFEVPDKARTVEDIFKALDKQQTLPNMIVNSYGDKEWRLNNGKRHRVDGPAIEYSNGDKEWYINGVFQREEFK